MWDQVYATAPNGLLHHAFDCIYLRIALRWAWLIARGAAKVEMR